MVNAHVVPETSRLELIAVRTQSGGEPVYCQVRIKAPVDLRIPRAQRQDLDKIAPHDLGRYPRLIPLDDSVRAVAWHFATESRTLEFLGGRVLPGVAALTDK